MSDSDSDSSTCIKSEKFDPFEALYGKNVLVPVTTAPKYENISQFISAQTRSGIIPIGGKDLVVKRNTEKERLQNELKEKIAEINRKRFENIEVFTTVPKKAFVTKNILTKAEAIVGPLSALRNCVNNRQRVKIVTRNATGVRGHIIGSVQAFDKQWNLALTDVLEVWTRKVQSKRKVPACMGEQVPRGTAASKGFIPSVKETPLRKGVVECSRYMPQLMIRGEHVVLISIFES